MTEDDLDRLLRDVVLRLVEALSPDRIYLFGSHARGEAGPRSDIDILVVVPQSDQPGHVRDRSAYHALRGIAAPIEVLVWTRDEYERALRIRTSLSASVERSGRLLYAA